MASQVRTASLTTLKRYDQRTSTDSAGKPVRELATRSADPQRLPHDIATRVARDERFDLHALIELVERGCPPDLAVRILAPIEVRIDEA